MSVTNPLARQFSQRVSLQGVRLPRDLCYPSWLRVHGLKLLGVCRVSLQRSHHRPPVRGPVTQHVFPFLHGVPTERVPPLLRYYGAVRLLTHVSLRSGFLRGAIPRWIRWFAPDPRKRRVRPGVANPVSPPGTVAWMRQVSHVPGESSCAYAMLSDPGGTRGPGHSAHRRGPLTQARKGLTTLRISRLNRTASALAVYAS